MPIPITPIKPGDLLLMAQAVNEWENHRGALIGHFDDAVLKHFDSRIKAAREALARLRKTMHEIDKFYA